MAAKIKVACIQNNASGAHDDNIAVAMRLVDRAAAAGARRWDASGCRRETPVACLG